MGSSFSCFRPAARVCPSIAITPDKVEIYLKKEGVRGMLPLGCLPLWGREGVILITIAKNYQMMREKDSFNKAIKV